MASSAMGVASVKFVLLLQAIALSRLLQTGQALRRAQPQGAGCGGGEGNFANLEKGLASMAAARDGRTCLYFPGPFMGRLSNTVAMMNVALRLAENTHARFLWPRYYTEYMEEEHFSDIFGKGDPDCLPHYVQVYTALCDKDKPLIQNPGMGARCSTDTMLVDLAAPQTIFTTNMCQCRKAVQIDGEILFWDHDYSKTYHLLSKRYWESHSVPLFIPTEPGSMAMKSVGGFMGSSKPQVVVHVRLGDVEDEKECLKKWSLYNCQKKVQVQIFQRILQSLMQVLPMSCADIDLVTDGTPQSPDIIAISETMTDAGWKAPKVWSGDRLSTAKTFALMTHADVLVYGPSGFGQVAAVLAHPRTARIGTPLPTDNYPSDPLFYLPNTTQLHHEGTVIPDVAKITADIRTNAALMALVARCRR